MPPIKANDTVQVISGSDKGKRGRVVRVLTDEGRVLIEGVRLVYEHVRKSRKNPQGGGRLQREMPIDASNVLWVCPHCDKPARLGAKWIEEGGRRSRLRLCRKCKKEIR